MTDVEKKIEDGFAETKKQKEQQFGCKLRSVRWAIQSLVPEELPEGMKFKFGKYAGWSVSNVGLYDLEYLIWFCKTVPKENWELTSYQIKKKTKEKMLSNIEHNNLNDNGL